MRNPFILILSLAATLTIACKNTGKFIAGNADSVYTVSGKIAGVDSGWIYIKHRQTEKLSVDSAPLKHGGFSISGKAAAPEFCNFGIAADGKKDYYFGFFLQHGDLNVTANKDSLNDAAVKFSGSPVQDEFKHFQQLAKPIDSADYQLQLANDTAKQANNQDRLTFISLHFKGLERKRKELIKDYAIHHTDSYIAAFEVYSYFTDEQDIVTLKDRYNAMPPPIQDSYFGKKIMERLMKTK